MSVKMQETGGSQDQTTETAGRPTPQAISHPELVEDEMFEFSGLAIVGVDLE